MYECTNVERYELYITGRGFMNARMNIARIDASEILVSLKIIGQIDFVEKEVQGMDF